MVVASLKFRLGIHLDILRNTAKTINGKTIRDLNLISPYNRS
jgi:hypothetical protein